MFISCVLGTSLGCFSRWYSLGYHVHEKQEFYLCSFQGADSDNCLSERRQSRVTQPYLNGRHNSASSSASEDTPTRKMSSTLNITLSPPVKVKPSTPVTIQIDTNSLANNGIAPSIPSNYHQTTASSRIISRGDSTDISTDFDDYDPPKEAGKSPEFLSELEDVHFVEGTSARLRCKVSGEPKPDFVWLKDGTEIKEGKKYKVDVFDEEVILTVRDTTSRDAGSYILEARNSEGMAKSSAELLVTGEFHIVSYHLLIKLLIFYESFYWTRAVRSKKNWRLPFCLF